MNQKRHDKIAEILHRKAAEFIRDEASSTSLITVTRVELTPVGRDATIFFTTLPESEEKKALLFLERKTPELKQQLIHESRIGMIPHLRFEIDYGERNRQRLDELGGKI